jgi:pimeloyl-ACP methyl ester carboxylesterase
MKSLGLVTAAGLLLAGVVACMPPSWGAGALLHPSRRLVDQQPKLPFDRVELEGDGVLLQGWWFHGAGQKRGTIVYLHGVGDNRGSSIGIADRFVPRGFDVIAYDSRAHGGSQGDACTYGYFEKRDLGRVLAKIQMKPIILLGSSLGAAVALQTAAEDHRVDAVVAVAAFSDLRTVANERAPFFASKANVNEALRQAEDSAHFRVDDVSPVNAAARIVAPTLVVHGDHDRETPYAHSLRIFAALQRPKRLILVPNRGHHDSLTPEVWRDIDAWLEGVLKTR